jgi:hypothetical protein
MSLPWIIVGVLVVIIALLWVGFYSVCKIGADIINGIWRK